jgi:hypothetical protein
MLNRSASSYAAIATAGSILEEVFKDIGISEVDHVELVREFFKEAIENPNEPYPIKACGIYMNMSKFTGTVSFKKTMIST